MKLTGSYRIVVEGDTTLNNPRNDSVGYLFQRLLTGEEAVMENLANLGIRVAIDDSDQLAAAHLRRLAATAGDDRSAGCYLHAAEQIERGEHRGDAD